MGELLEILLTVVWAFSLKHKGEVVVAIPEINEMNPVVFLGMADINKWGQALVCNFTVR